MYRPTHLTVPDPQKGRNLRRMRLVSPPEILPSAKNRYSMCSVEEPGAAFTYVQQNVFVSNAEGSGGYGSVCRNSGPANFSLLHVLGKMFVLWCYGTPFIVYLH